MRLGPCFCERRSIIEEDQCGKKVILFHCIALATDTSWGNIRVELLSPMKTWHSFPIDTIRMKSSFMHPNFLHHSLRKFITQAILSLGSRNWECPPQKKQICLIGEKYTWRTGMACLSTNTTTRICSSSIAYWQIPGTWISLYTSL